MPDRTLTQGYCQCGCGEQTTTRYVHGHNRRGLSPSETTRRKQARFGEAHPGWRGDDVSNAGLHSWMRENYPKAECCEHCGKRGPTDYARIRPDAGRNRANWLELCRRCHARFDGQSAETREKRSRALRGRERDAATVARAATANRARNVNRDAAIRAARDVGVSVRELAETYGRTPRSIRRILRGG